MSPEDVHYPEMPSIHTRDVPDDWPTSDPALAAFAEDLRIVASGPAPEPRPGLLAVMAQGPVLPPEPATKKSKMLVRSIVGSLAAKVALGVGVAAASVTAVGATGVLPDQAQHAVASVVSATTPFVLPDPSTARPRVGDDPTHPGGSSTSKSVASTSTTLASKTGDEPAGGVTGEDPAGGDRADNHGGCVSAVAQDKSGTDSHGKTVSSVARSDCGKTTISSTVPGSSTTSSTSSTSTSTTVAGANTTNGGPGNSGKGNGNGTGGNGGNGGNGNGNPAGNGNNGKGNGGGSGSSDKG